VANTADVGHELLDVEKRRLEERGYTVYRGRQELVPPPLKPFVPDAIAIGREPNYLIELVREGPGETDRLQTVRRQLAQVPGWELLVILDRGGRAPELRQASQEELDKAISSARHVLASGETAPAMLLTWGVLEALSRRMLPDEFGRPQTPGRLIQILASGGHVDTASEHVLRRLAKARNAIIHGELSAHVEPQEAERFLDLVSRLRNRLGQADASADSATS
jgi:ribosomal protein L29